MSIRTAALTSAAILIFSQSGASQEVDTVTAFGMDTISVLPIAATYESAYSQFRAIEPDHGRVAAINEPITLQREGIGLTFNSGYLVQLTNVMGRTVAIGFMGEGALSYSPDDPVEQRQLLREFDEAALDAEIESAVIIFGDETLQELEQTLEFGPGNGSMGNAIRRTLEYIGEDDYELVNISVMRTLLNGSRNEVFYAHVDPTSGRDLIVMVDPWAAERNSLARVISDGRSELVSQFGERSVRVGDRVGEPTVADYAIEVWMPRTGAGNLRFRAEAEMKVVGHPQCGTWLPFFLHNDLEIDSVLFSDGSRSVYHKPEDSPVLWVKGNSPLQTDDTLNLRVYYHGDMVERFGEMFFIQSSIAWYPWSFNWLSRSTFDIVFHTAETYDFASIGDQVESSVEDGTLTTRWRSRRPIRNASFNIGLFERYEVEEGDGPDVTVLYADAAHRGFRGAIPQGRNMKQQVGADIRNSLNFFENRFGPSGLDHFYATEIPYSHGEAFPGMVHLAISTFINTDREGFHEWFRAHEVAHQWWALGVDFASSRDQWLSEGFASFSALWYLQSVRGENDQYFNMLRDWRDDLRDQRGSPSDPDRGWGPIALGGRVADRDRPGAVNGVIYRKGAFVLHMLRTMMLNLQTMDETPFTEMMRDFFLSYRGGNASTDDFQRFTENHIGMPMDWFFDQWVRGTYVPKYHVRWRAEEADGGRYRLRISVRQEHVPEGFRAYVPIAVDFGDNRQARLRVEVSGDGELQLPLMPLEPRGIDFNALEGVLAEVDVSRWR